MKLKYNFILNPVADSVVAVAVGEDLEKFNGFVKMNDIGAEIFEILKNDVTEQEIVDIMKAKHPEEPEAEVIEAVSGFLAGLKENGVI